ncbi:tetratricopeptide repeat protein (macronuclear) [Tetrahymena thermophila SB210]|uniref:Tetratricopeptide repeat protein n=1 Tax=Tetrahymena thermophila (strain SB210) TaxID=312017 RepID=I7MEB6_TETTS|nr:tetratricopeptide repeat protein [Tetrahymena thermophila SB210]EAR96018.2 tetratricopeptide repeat protein [Tetrahymena thermophila SB210]|eukprot:XP_001016263.2 tetratricopeptide repeat protein [Tetrahymena thermophila SB210]
MKSLIIRLIITVSTPIIVGVALVLLIFYKSLWNALYQWEDESLKWINQTQQQILHNSAYPQYLIETYSFNQLQLHLVVINSIIQKYYGSELKINPKANFLKCSNREFTFNQCTQDVYTKLNQSIYYVDLYFVRERFSFNKLTIQQQEFIAMNEFISYYGRAAILASISEELLKIQTLYNADTTSLMTHQPSRNLNFTASTYQTCLGTDFIEPYDPRCRQWYQYAKQQEGYFFYEPYLDAINGILEMTLSSRIDYNSEFMSVNSIDYEMNSITDIFKTSQSQNAYSVLFHEFNNTIFYHPLLNASDIVSWGDLEFKNLTDNCKEVQDLEDCKIEKQKFFQQLNSTVNFIQASNYSIEQQINTDGLYQYWSRYGVDLSQITKYPTQQPYSFSIILTARVLVDQSNSLKLFNLLNANSIKIPLLIEFIVLSGLIVAFIVNYGNFQIYQIQYPIELLTIFLKKSLIEQQQFQNQSEKEKSNNQIIKYLNTINSPNRSQSKSNIIQHKSKIALQDQSILNISSQNKIKQRFTFQAYDKSTIQQDQINLKEKTTQNQDEILETSNRLFQSQFKREFLNESKMMTKQTNYINHNNNNNNNNNNNKQNNNIDRISIDNSSDRSQNRLINYNYSVTDFNLIKRSTNMTRVTNDFDFISKIEQIEENEKGQSKILSGLKPLFLEMKIIKKAFQMLEGVINYQIQAYSNDQQDVMQTLFHFSKAKSTFQNLQNQTGVSRCYFNLGIVYLLKNEYEQSCEYFEASIMQSLQFIGLESLDQINENMFINIDNDQKDQLFIFYKKYIEQLITKNIIIELLKAKQKFLSGIIQKQNNNYKQAIEYFTQSLENGTYFNPQLRQQVIVNLKYLFNKLCIQQNVIDEQFDEFDCDTPIDFVYVIQLDSISSTIIAESCLENIKKSNFFKTNDRIQIIIFNQELDVLLPYTKIINDHNWQLMIGSIKKIGLNTIQNQQSDLKQLDWIQGINKALDHIYELKELDLVKLNQIYKLNKKPIVLHLKDYQSIIDNNQQPQQQSNFIEYEEFYEENKLITKLNKLRDQEIFNPEYEFMAILNNY